MDKNFDLFLEQLKETNLILPNLTDFKKVENAIETISIKLNQLNYLIGKKDLKSAIKNLYKENPKCFSVLNILVAVRKPSTKIVVKAEQIEKISYYFDTPEKIYDFITKTGLKSVNKKYSDSNINRKK